MTGIGVCIILKYVMIRTDLLLPELQNHDGQKIVGIIVTCVGVFGIIISAVVAILYFTVCHESRSGHPAITQKICKNGIKIDSDMPSTPKMQANGQNRVHSSHLLPPKSPSKPSKLKSPSDSKRIDSAKPISTIETPLTSTPKRIVKEVDGNVPVPLLQVNGIDISHGRNDFILKPILKPSCTTTTTTPLTSNIPSTNSIEPAAAGLANAYSVSRSLFPMRNIPDSSTDNNHNNNNNTTTTKASASSGFHTSCLHSKSDHDTTTTTTTTQVHQSNCDSDQDGQTQNSDCEITCRL